MALHEIYTAQDLKDFRDLVNSGDYTASAILMNDINLAGNDTDQWIPINDFSGVFDGNGFTISGLYTNDYDDEYLAFIIRMNSGTVKNLTLRGIFASQGSYTAGFVGHCVDSQIINCHSYLNLNINFGNIIGGIVCEMQNGNITNCTNESQFVNDFSGTFSGICAYAANVNIDNCINNTNISTVDNISHEYAENLTFAGICYSLCNGNINNCINNGNATSKHGEFAGILNIATSHDYFEEEYNYNTSVNIINCINKGNINGIKYGANAAGIVLDLFCGDIINCINEGNINGTSSAGIVGCYEIVNIINCINTGNISGNNDEPEMYNYSACSGIILGSEPFYANNQYYSAYIKNCINMGNVSGYLVAGIIISIGSSQNSLTELKIEYPKFNFPTDITTENNYIKNCVNEGTITIEYEDEESVTGAIIGLCYEPIDGCVLLSNNYYLNTSYNCGITSCDENESIYTLHELIEGKITPYTVGNRPNNVGYIETAMLIDNISSDVNLAEGPVLNHDSLLRLINKAKIVINKTLRFGFINAEKLSPEEKEITTNKGWILL